jgi:hypothetical protein
MQILLKNLMRFLISNGYSVGSNDWCGYTHSRIVGYSPSTNDKRNLIYWRKRFPCGNSMFKHIEVDGYLGRKSSILDF